ncbi:MULTISPECIES: sigma factor [unclassified Rathayibacter]|uniref:sigma factor n=1 Tax=unclassified Rathayibacter TaxID=2609250 RepID=UPI000F4BD1EA|nr:MULTISPECIES: sigma factor [unclassified Rathayibacter]ROP48660.1 RNA polymerase sigma-70 factor (ECF subfamily) [Rathayibacter sp. PhB186]ROS49809.1 RNA polymerase sigma-70 factor (ECF subfamily) [Rathayibacter sp. PhB185]TCL80124.1 RNA polymerase sigma-70 factor (ECF subfamily) [Rathayibacter sp. PhB192]TCM25565.1 RNA polymerase sigma-70 factor (ECF subfamily) [Rathayibacter sp. PhB179]
MSGSDDEQAVAFEAERGRLTRLASRLLDDHHEAEDAVQSAWLRLHGTTAAIDNLPAWLTTVTTRLCLDRLRARIPEPAELVETGTGVEGVGTGSAGLERAEAVGQALHVVVETLTPNERVAFVLADSFGVDFATIGEILGRSAVSARKLASRARAKTTAGPADGPVADWQVVDAFMAAARGGDLARLLLLLAPGASIRADADALAAGTPERIDGREAVAAFFDGSAHAALAAVVDGRPGAAWFHRGAPQVAFDFTVEDGRVTAVVFRADPAVLASIRRREGAVVDAG